MAGFSLEVFEDIFSKFNAMEGKEVDLSILTKFDDVIHEFSRIQKLWISEKKVHTSTMFLFYLSSKNCEMIMKRMKERFENAKKNHDNPKVVDDAEVIMPIINDIYFRNINGLSKKTKITPIDTNSILEVVFSLRDVARKVNMLPSKEDELSGLSKRMLNSQFQKLDNNIGMIINES